MCHPDQVYDNDSETFEIKKTFGIFRTENAHKINATTYVVYIVYRVHICACVYCTNIKRQMINQMAMHRMSYQKKLT